MSRSVKSDCGRGPLSFIVPMVTISILMVVLERSSRRAHMHRRCRLTKNVAELPESAQSVASFPFLVFAAKCQLSQHRCKHRAFFCGRLGSGRPAVPRPAWRQGLFGLWAIQKELAVWTFLRAGVPSGESACRCHGISFCSPGALFRVILFSCDRFGPRRQDSVHDLIHGREELSTGHGSSIV